MSRWTKQLLPIGTWAFFLGTMVWEYSSWQCVLGMLGALGASLWIDYQAQFVVVDDSTETDALKTGLKNAEEAIHRLEMALVMKGVVRPPEKK